MSMQLKTYIVKDTICKLQTKRDDAAPYWEHDNVHAILLHLLYHPFSVGRSKSTNNKKIINLFLNKSTTNRCIWYNICYSTLYFQMQIQSMSNIHLTYKPFCSKRYKQTTFCASAYWSINTYNASMKYECGLWSAKISGAQWVAGEASKMSRESK